MHTHVHTHTHRLLQLWGCLPAPSFHTSPCLLPLCQLYPPLLSLKMADLVENHCRRSRTFFISFKSPVLSFFCLVSTLRFFRC